MRVSSEADGSEQDNSDGTEPLIDGSHVASVEGDGKHDGGLHSFDGRTRNDGGELFSQSRVGASSVLNLCHTLCTPHIVLHKFDCTRKDAFFALRAQCFCCMLGTWEFEDAQNSESSGGGIQRIRRIRVGVGLLNNGMAMVKRKGKRQV